MAGFIVFDYEDRYPEAAKAIGELISAGKLTPREDVVGGGIEKFGETLNLLFEGANTGKLVLKL